MRCLTAPSSNPRGRRLNRPHSLLPRPRRGVLSARPAQLPKPTRRGVLRLRYDLRRRLSPSYGCHLRHRHRLAPFPSSSRHPHHPIHGPQHPNFRWARYPLPLQHLSLCYDDHLRRSNPPRPICSTMTMNFQIFCLLRANSHRPQIITA